MDLNDLLKGRFKDPKRIEAILDKLTDGLIAEAQVLHRRRRRLHQRCARWAPPPTCSRRGPSRSMVKQFSARDPRGWGDVPKVYHICGDTNMIITDMAELAHDAMSVDQKNDVKATPREAGRGRRHPRQPEPVRRPDEGHPEHHRRGRLRDHATNGVDAVWPGCDIWPQTPAENMKAWVDAQHEVVPRRKA